MNPNQVPYVAPPGPNQYDFITNSGKSPKKSLLGGGDPFIKRIILILGGAILFVIIVTIAVTLLGGSGGSKSELKKLVLQQQELARVATIGVEKAQGQDTKSLAITTQLSVATQSQDLTTVLSARGVTLTKEELAANTNSQTDKTLDAAVNNNRFDEAFNAELTNQIQAYLTALQTAYNGSSNDETKAVLSESYASASKLLPPTATP